MKKRRAGIADGKTAEAAQRQAGETPQKEPHDGPQERQELVGQLQRLQAEFENYQRRVEKERQEQGAWAKGELLKRLLPVLDHLELALANATPAAQADSAFHKGVELIAAQLLQLLEEEGVTPLGEENARFDPHAHEAMLTEARDGVEKGAILEVLQKGYSLNGRILRTAKVKVAK